MTKVDITARLAELRTTAPDGLVHRVLEATGTGARYAVVAGPIGPLAVLFSAKGVTGCAPVDKLDDYLEHHGIAAAVLVERLPRNLEGRVRRALDSGRLRDLPVDLAALSEFQRTVLQATATIPPGEIRPYGWVAREIGKPGAVRAVGSALNKNPIPVLIPCHRVGKSDGHIGNYAYGSQMKRKLLAAEGLDPDAVDELADRRVRFTGSDTTQIYCHPSCHAAQRTSPAHVVEFRDAASALAQGYRPCKLCRPQAA